MQSDSSERSSSRKKTLSVPGFSIERRALQFAGRERAALDRKGFA